MKRRIPGLGSSTAGKKKKPWEEEAEADAKKSKSKPETETKHESDDELWEALEAENKEDGGGSNSEDNEEEIPSGDNPIVWMQLSMAGQSRGKLFFELFRDVAPRTSENFRKLCLGVELRGQKIGYKGTEMHKIIPGKIVEGGDFDQSATGKEFIDETFKLKHSKAGLLSMTNRGPNTNSSRFQITFSSRPPLDNKQVVFGQLVADPSGDDAPLHPLHWIEAMGAASGDPREAVIIEDAGECGSTPVVPSESEAARYSRGGIQHGKLEDAVTAENIKEVLDLTQDILENLEWQTKKISRSEEGRERTQNANAVEEQLRVLKAVLEKVEHHTGEAQGFENTSGRSAKAQMIEIKDLEEQLRKLY